MEEIVINGNTWHKYKGDEGQDVYIAQFTIPSDKLLGKYVDESFYDLLIDNDADVYFPPECDMTKSQSSNEERIDCIDESRLAFKFRKNVFTPEEQLGAFEGLYDSAVESNNRGMAAGPRSEQSGNRDWVTPFQADIIEYYAKGQPQSIDGSDQIESIIEKHKRSAYETRGSVWLRSKIESEFGQYTDFFDVAMKRLKEFEVYKAEVYAKQIRKVMISDTSYASPIWSGIAGFYGRYPRIPYGRATSFVEHNRAKFEKCYPFARKLDAEFKRLVPGRYEKQKVFSDRLDDKFIIGEDTTFTTITVNTTQSDRNARCACHRDAGSLNEGFSNLTVITKDGKDWNGGYLVTPEVRAAINIRPGDLLLIDNMRIIHGNTPIKEPDSGPDEMLRMSLIFYYREDMDKLGSWDYEHTRRAFVDSRRLNKGHELWRPFWNGVSPSMWTSDEWYDYLHAQDKGLEWLEDYHPEALEEKATLEGFF
jgi:hypothetical protein